MLNSAFLLLQTTIKFVRINLKIYICRSEPQCDYHIVALFYFTKRKVISMIKAKIENGKETQYLELPCEQETLNAKFGGGDGEIKVSFSGESEFESRLISLIRPGNRLSTINCICGFYENLPSVDKSDIQDAVMNGRVFSFSDFGKLVIDRRQQDVTEYYYCPLVARVYPRDEYGGYDEYPDDYDGDYLTQYEDKIRKLIKQEELCGENLAAYFAGSDGAVSKLKEIHFGTQNVDGIIYGKIRVELTERLTDEENAEIKEFLIGQCADGLGEGLEQREIEIPEGIMYVSFWNADDYFMLGEEEFDERLTRLEMGGIE